uniref:Uncharacterized protein n=1 Tax=Favella ehrenbergii TaxID=182087 RepID=A0A7S3MM06_9SPIT|mmetsp:Transcript_22506/g.27789  ORF Transcript_22506/g.27789 Transcript_22506/m.27789 type:complete len:273 (+) Transcript_22506:803-1621(+)
MARRAHSVSDLATFNASSLLHLRQLLLEPLDDLLAKVGSLCQLLLDFFVDLDFALVSLNLLLHLVVFEDQNFGLFRLMLELGRQLMILQDRQMRRRLQLLVVHREQVRLCLFYIEKHLLAQLLCLLYTIEFFLIDLLETKSLLGGEPLNSVGKLLLELALLGKVAFHISLAILKVLHLVRHLFQFNRVFLVNPPDLSLVTFNCFFEFVLEIFLVGLEVKHVALKLLLIFLDLAFESLEVLIRVTLLVRQYADLLLVVRVLLLQVQVALLDHG